MEAAELEKERAESEAREVAAALQHWVALALDLGTPPEAINTYLRDVRNFVFRNRPVRNGTRQPVAFEVVR